MLIRSICLFLVLSANLYAQDCNITISGRIIDNNEGTSLEFANIYINELSQGCVSDSLGYFFIANLCPDKYHLTISHVGCNNANYYLDLSKDTFLTVNLNHNDQVLDDVLIIGKALSDDSQIQHSISETTIQDNALTKLADLTAEIPGVSSLKTGYGVSKPIIQGNYGNRVNILNNGVPLAGQKWGTDHAPEIDPLTASSLNVVKGASALEHIGSNLGGVILIEHDLNTTDPHLHGFAGYAFETNGRGQSLSAMLKKGNEKSKFRFTSSAKKGGDKRAPDYFLNNTGFQEINASLLYKRVLNSRWDSELFASSYNTEIGILRGAHISNTTDLNLAFGREVPYFTEDEFSYGIDAPRQLVNHNLAKLTLNFSDDYKNTLKVSTAVQFNQRKEYDIRRGNRTSKPTMDLDKFSFFSEIKHKRIITKNLILKSGIQNLTAKIKNDFSTGILPIIPNHISNEVGLFSILNYQYKKHDFELGFRSDYAYYDVKYITREVPRIFVDTTQNFINVSGLFVWNTQVSKKSVFNLSVGAASRAPAINELYSYGLHQGVSGFEEGDMELLPERSLKTSATFRTESNKFYELEVNGYFQNVQNFILLVPQLDIVATIRGIFPLFKYEQKDVNIFGLDFSSRFNLSRHFTSNLSASLIKGYELNADRPLINLPSNNFKLNLEYSKKEAVSIFGLKFDDINFSVEGTYTAKQFLINEELDYLPAPDAYFLLNTDFSLERKLNKVNIRYFGSVTNLLNTEYRDYLNRQRYFADELGINVTLGLRVNF
jgi:iron complex outermembrane recepter protein